jgi:hypothetical protein
MGSAATAFANRSQFVIVDRLNREWDELLEVHDETVAVWSAEHPALAGCHGLADVLAAVRRDSDAVLFALLTERERGVELAGRVVLQAMLGKIVVMAVRDRGAEVDDYVAAMWCGICTYPLRQRPARIAANLGLDALKAVKREGRWSRADVAVMTLPQGVRLDGLQAEALARTSLDHNHTRALTATGVLAAADELGLIDRGTRAVMASVYADGLSGRDAAARHATSPDMVRFRCSKGVRRLAQHAQLLADAA